MRTQIALLSSLVALGAMAPVAAFAQDAPAATTPAPPPDPVSSPTPAAVEASAETPAPAGAAAVQPPAAGATPMPGWIRVDSDAGSIQVWGGGTYPLTDSIGLAFDMYLVPFPSLGEIDVGPAITAGPFILTPMLGFQANWSTRHAQALVPQLYLTGGPSPFYIEVWFQYYINSIFNDGASNQIYGRLIADYKLNDYIAIGPEIDLGYDSQGLPNAEGESKKLNSLPIGVNVLLSNVGVSSSFMTYLAYETMDPAATDSHLTGRLTFIHNF